MLLIAVLAAACGGQVVPPVAENILPRARLSGPSYAPIGGTVTFDASESFDTDGTIVEYTFHFSDGSRPVTQASPELEHVFTSSGAFESAVIVKDSSGALAGARLLVVVRTDPPLCTATTDCRLNEECRNTLCYISNADVNDASVECQADDDCGPTLICRAGLCLTDPDAALP